MKLQFRLNGKNVETIVPGEKRLLDFIREDLHLTGTKEGCGIGECGACTVVLNRSVPPARIRKFSGSSFKSSWASDSVCGCIKSSSVPLILFPPVLLHSSPPL